MPHGDGLTAFRFKRSENLPTFPQVGPHIFETDEPKKGSRFLGQRNRWNNERSERRRLGGVIHTSDERQRIAAIAGVRPLLNEPLRSVLSLNDDWLVQLLKGIL